MVRWGMAVNLERCIGCQACTLACKEENTTPDGIYWQRVIFNVKGNYPAVQAEWYPRPCMHCENAPCIAVCPTSARFKRDDGLVLVDWDKCIGCGYCLIACPYDVNYIHRKTLLKPSIREAYGDEPIYRIPEGDNRRGFGIPPRGVAEKCTFCVHRIDKGVRKGLTPGVDMEASPACVEACPARALAFGDLDDPRSEVSRLVAGRKGFRLREELGTKPQVYYLR